MFADNLRESHELHDFLFFNGDGEIRTLDLLTAFFQLIYVLLKNGTIYK